MARWFCLYAGLTLVLADAPGAVGVRRAGENALAVGGKGHVPNHRRVPFELED
jgi:hypothetical protein